MSVKTSPILNYLPFLVSISVRPDFSSSFWYYNIKIVLECNGGGDFLILQRLILNTPVSVTLNQQMVRSILLLTLRSRP